VKLARAVQSRSFMRTSHCVPLVRDTSDDTQPQWLHEEWDLTFSDGGGSFNASLITRSALGIARWIITTNGVDIATGQALDASGAVVGCLELKQLESGRGMSITLSLPGLAGSGVFTSNDRDEIIENSLAEMGSAAVLWMEAFNSDVSAFLRADPTPTVVRRSIAKKLLVRRCSKTLADCAAAVALSMLSDAAA